MSLPSAEEWIDPGSMDAPLREGSKAWMVGAAIPVTAIVLFAVWYTASLWGLPDIGEPFDMRVLGTVEIPANENAFTYYRQASEKLIGRGPSDSNYASWGQIPLADKEWFFANAPAIELWLEGTIQDRAVYVQPKDMRVDTPPGVLQDLMTFATLAEIAGLRMEAAGDPEQAWIWYRAGLRSSRHCGMHGGFLARLEGIALYRRFAASIRGWADQPNLTTDDLRQALEEVIIINEMTPTLAENLRTEYFVLDAALTEKASWDLVSREPEKSRRLARLILLNRLAVAGLSPSEMARRARRGRLVTLYDPPPAPKNAGLLTPAHCDAWIDSTLYLRLMLTGWDAFAQALANEAALRAGVVVRLAEELYKRDHGKLPDSPDQLVGPYLKSLPEGFEAPEKKRP